MKCPVYKIVRDGVAVVSERKKPVAGPKDTAAVLTEFFRDYPDREAFVVVLLNARHGIVGIHLVSVGSLSTSLVHPREVFKPAILASAAAIVIAHNHPSGDPEPSAEDISITRRLASAGTIIGIEVLDHLIIGDPGRWVCLKERGVL